MAYWYHRSSRHRGHWDYWHHWFRGNMMMVVMEMMVWLWQQHCFCLMMREFKTIMWVRYRYFMSNWHRIPSGQWMSERDLYSGHSGCGRVGDY